MRTKRKSGGGGTTKANNLGVINLASDLVKVFYVSACILSGPNVSGNI